MTGMPMIPMLMIMARLPLVPSRATRESASLTQLLDLPLSVCVGTIDHHFQEVIPKEMAVVVVRVIHGPLEALQLKTIVGWSCVLSVIYFPLPFLPPPSPCCSALCSYPSPCSSISCCSLAPSTCRASSPPHASTLTSLFTSSWSYPIFITLCVCLSCACLPPSDPCSCSCTFTLASSPSLFSLSLSSLCDRLLLLCLCRLLSAGDGGEVGREGETGSCSSSTLESQVIFCIYCNVFMNTFTCR